MQVDRKKIESSLPSKRFVIDKTHHKYFYHEYQGKRSGAYTYTSRGSKYKSYGKSLLQRMKKELKLDTIQQVVDLINCPIKEADYNQILKNKGII